MISELDANNISSRLDFCNFVDALILDYSANRSEWENTTLDSYLSALSAWARDMDGYYINKNGRIPENINWKIFAEIMSAARVYE